LTANHFNLNRNTVSRLINSVREVSNSSLSASWRSKLTETMPQLSVDAMERSITDLNDPHRAANTAIQHLKGIGALQTEGSSTVNVFVANIGQLPANWREEYQLSDADTTTYSNKDADSVIDVTPEPDPTS
jgi:hypothetical protein